LEEVMMSLDGVQMVFRNWFEDLDGVEEMVI
jgi:hypothetical protein